MTMGRRNTCAPSRRGHEHQLQALADGRPAHEKAGFRAMGEVQTPDGTALLMVCQRTG
jgi:hypothetical protein